MTSTQTTQLEFLKNLIIQGAIPEDPQTQKDLKATLGELEMLKTALDLSSIVAFTDAKGKITHVNDNFCEISGYSKEELIGQDHRLVNSGFHSKDFFTDMWKTLFSGKVWKGEICNKKKNGTPYWVDTTIVPFSKEGPYQSRYVAIRNDITERKRMQHEIEEGRLRTLYAEKMASLGELTAGIAHELGNPIATIQGRAEMLMMYAGEGHGEMHEQALKTAQIVMKVTARMDNILRSMRAFARDGDQDPFSRTPLSVLLDNTVEFGFEKYRKRGVAVLLEPYPENLSIECRETQIIQILINLLNNACDAIQDLPEKWIRISIEENEQDVCIHLTDSGKGISQEIQDKIFSQFFTTKSVGKGTGLGLFISKSLARQHRGDLFVDSTSPNTKFVLRLPKRQINDTSVG